jgi:hypothetical protein
MDRSVDIIEEHKAAADSLLSNVFFETIGELLAAISNLLTGMAALRRGYLKTLHQRVSQFVMAIIFAMRSTVRWHARAASSAVANVIWGQRNLHHPPQTWAAP